MQLSRLQIKDFLCFDHLEVDFSGMKNVLLVGHNGAGKSSFVDAISWCLFGAVGKKNCNGEKVIRDLPESKNQTSVSVDLYIGAKLYSITRTKKRRHTASLDIVVNGVKKKFRKLESAQFFLNRRLVLNASTFFNVVYYSQEDVAAFVAANSAERVKMLTELFDLSIIDDSAKLIDKQLAIEKTRNANLAGQLQVYNTLLSGDHVQTMIAERNRNKKKYKKNKLHINYLQKLANKTKLYHQQLQDLNNAKRAFKQERSEFKAHARAIRKQRAYLKKLVSRRSDGADIEVQINLIQRSLSELPVLTKETNLINGKLMGTATRLSRFETKIFSLNAEVARLKKLKSGDKCPTCYSVITGSVDAHISNEIEILKNLILELSERIIACNKKRERLQTRHDKISAQIEKLTSKKNKLAALRERLTTLSEAQIKINAITDELAVKRADHKITAGKLRTKVVNAKLRLQTTKNNNNNIEKINESTVKIQLQDAIIESSKMMADINILSKQIADFYEKERKFKALTNSSAVLESEIDNLNWLKPAMARFKLYVISVLKPLLQQTANDYLAEIAPTKSIEFEIDGSKTQNRFNIKIHDSEFNSPRELDSLSGGERQIVALVIFMAFNYVLGLAKKAGFVVLDEKFASVDTENRTSILKLFRSKLFGEKKIFVISHEPEISRYFESVLRFKKINGVSRVKIIQQTVASEAI